MISAVVGRQSSPPGPSLVGVVTLPVTVSGKLYSSAYPVDSTCVDRPILGTFVEQTQLESVLFNFSISLASNSG